MSKQLDSKVAFAGINVCNRLIEQLEFFRTQLIINPTDTVVTEQMQIINTYYEELAKVTGYSAQEKRGK